MTDKIRVGLVGYGMAGRVFHVPYIRSTSTLQIITISTSRKEEVAKLDPTILVVATPQEVFQNPKVDLVVIASPSSSHASLTGEALRAGKHVVVDKPFALQFDEAKDLVNLSKTVGKHLFVFHNRRWDSDFLTIRAAIEEGVIGNIVQFESHIDRFRPTVQNRWREDGSEGSGVWFDLGPHLVDQAILLFGRPDAVYADIAALREGGKSPDFAHVVLHYPKRRVILQASMNAPGGKAGGLPRFSIHGTKGSLVKYGVDPQEAQSIAGLKPGDEGWGVDHDPLHIFDGIGGETTRPAVTGSQQKYYEIVGDILLCEKNGTVSMVQAPISHEEILWVQEVIEAGLLSAKEGCVIHLTK